MKSPKTPVFGQNSKILSFDLETNGLHGQAFAVAAIILDVSGQEVDKFVARIKIEGQVDEWVAENVIPVIEDIGITHNSYDEMTADFWKWFVDAQEKCDYVVVSNGYPVEYRFLIDCQNKDLKNRYWEHPFPILELPSMLIGAGMVKDSDRLRFISGVVNSRAFVRHHPLDDAKATALTATAVLGQN